MSIFDQQMAKMKADTGFVAALDQSGGSTPKTLGLYGVEETAWSDEAGMFDVMHAMRSRIVTSEAFNGERVLGAILFEMTMDREIEGQGSAQYLWSEKNVVPFLKVDQGLADEQGGIQLMNPIPGLDALLARAKEKGVFGTKMRSVIKQADSAGVKKIVAQQFEIGKQIIAAGLVPILEPEVDIHCPDKAAAEDMLKTELMAEINKLPAGDMIMLKLTLPEQADQYKDCVEHANVLKVVALSGGYSREEANRRLAQNHGMIASFSRALAEGLKATQSDAEFNAAINDSIESIYQASCT